MLTILSFTNIFSFYECRPKFFFVAFSQEEDRMQLSQFLREALFCLSIYQSPKDSLRIAVTELWYVKKHQYTFITSFTVDSEIFM